MLTWAHKSFCAGLVLDDEQQLRDLICQMLNSIVYVVRAVSSGKEAEFIKDNSTDLVLLDILVDHGVNGR